MDSLPLLRFDHSDGSRFWADVIAETTGGATVLHEADVLVSHFVYIRSLHDAVMRAGLHAETASFALLDFYFDIVLLH